MTLACYVNSLIFLEKGHYCAESESETNSVRSKNFACFIVCFFGPGNGIVHVMTVLPSQRNKKNDKVIWEKFFRASEF